MTHDMLMMCHSTEPNPDMTWYTTHSSPTQPSPDRKPNSSANAIPLSLPANPGCTLSLLFAYP
jgi:hypothetical protein